MSDRTEKIDARGETCRGSSGIENFDSATRCYDPRQLETSKLDKHMDVLDKNSTIVVSPSLFVSETPKKTDKYSQLSLVVGKVSLVLDNLFSDYDVSEEKCSIEGVCRMYENNQAFTTFRIRVYHSFAKGKPDEMRYVIVARKLSGDSLTFYRILNEMKSVFAVKNDGSIIDDPVSLGNCKRSFSSRGAQVQEEKMMRTYIDDLATILEGEFMDQKILAARALAHYARLGAAASKAIIENLSIVHSLMHIFDLADDLFIQPSYNHISCCELQLYTTFILAELSEDPKTAQLFINYGILERCFKSMLLVAQFEAGANRSRPRKYESVKRQNIKFWYRQSKRETARCLANIAAARRLEAADALRSRGFDYMMLSSGILSDDTMYSETRRFVSIFKGAEPGGCDSFSKHTRIRNRSA